jgi:hypothetical protein
VVVKETMEEDADGEVIIKKVNFKQTSFGRERFGSGTVNRPKFDLEQPPLKEFHR